MNLIPLTLSFLLGCGLGILPVAFGGLIGFALAVLALGAWLFRGKFPGVLKRLPLAFGLGLGLVVGDRADRDFHRQMFSLPQDQKASLRVWVSEEPEILFERQEGSHDTGRLNGFYQPWVKEVRAVCTVLSFNDAVVEPVKVRCTFRLSSEQPGPVLSYGDTVESFGKIQRPPRPLNPGQFDYGHFLKTRGVAYVAYLSPGQWRPAGDRRNQGDFLSRFANSLKRKAENTLFANIPFPENALLDGILLGQRGPIPSEMVESFIITGTAHILAVSGMNTALIAGLLFLLLRALQFNRRVASLFCLGGVGLFVLLTGANPPVCRAGLFSALALLAVLFERRIHGGTILLITAALLCAANPFVLQDLSFQISFIATAGLMVLTSRFLERLSFLWKPAAMLLATTAAAQFSVWCMLVYYFNQLSPFSLLANLFVVPLSLFVTAAGFTMILGSWVHPLLGQVFGGACEVSLNILGSLAQWLARLPGADFITASPPTPWVLVFHFLLLVSFFIYWPGIRPENPSPDWNRRESRYRRAKTVLRSVWVLFIIVSVFYFSSASFGPKPLRITFLAVGHGNATIVRSPEGKVALFDGGKPTRGPDRYSPPVSYLRHLGIRKVKCILNTHPDADHLGGLKSLASALPAGNIERSYEGWETQSASELFRVYSGLLQMKGIPLAAVKEGDVIEDLTPLEISVIHPPVSFRPRHNRENNRSLAVRLGFSTSSGEFSLILPGDLEEEGIRELLVNHRPFPKVDWLLAPHHGRLSGEQALCAEGMKPRFVVLSDWRDYADDHVLYRQGDPEAIVLSTAREGAVELEVAHNGQGRYRTFIQNQWKPFIIR